MKYLLTISLEFVGSIEFHEHLPMQCM
jgi:hypothetical protein